MSEALVPVGTIENPSRATTIECLLSALLVKDICSLASGFMRPIGSTMSSENEAKLLRGRLQVAYRNEEPAAE